MCKNFGCLGVSVSVHDASGTCAVAVLILTSLNVGTSALTYQACYISADPVQPVTLHVYSNSQNTRRKYEALRPTCARCARIHRSSLFLNLTESSVSTAGFIAGQAGGRMAQRPCKTSRAGSATPDRQHALKFPRPRKSVVCRTADARGLTHGHEVTHAAYRTEWRGRKNCSSRFPGGKQSKYRPRKHRLQSLSPCRFARIPRLSPLGIRLHLRSKARSAKAKRQEEQG